MGARMAYILGVVGRETPGGVGHTTSTTRVRQRVPCPGQTILESVQTRIDL